LPDQSGDQLDPGCLLRYWLEHVVKPSRKAVLESGDQYALQSAAIESIAAKLGIGSAETLRKWVRKAEVDAGRRAGTTSPNPTNIPSFWVMNADGTGQHRLTRDGGFPTWSPDCSMIAYAPGGGPSGRSSIVIMNADGSGRRRLPHTDYGEYPSWSPDGKRIAFNSNLSGEGLMYIVDVDGSRVVDLSRVGQGHEVAWSPDGRYIIFAAPGGFGVMRADGSGVASLPVEGVGEATLPDCGEGVASADPARAASWGASGVRRPK
jgi:hypothetical protein